MTTQNKGYHKDKEYRLDFNSGSVVASATGGAMLGASLGNAIGLVVGATIGAFAGAVKLADKEPSETGKHN